MATVERKRLLEVALPLVSAWERQGILRLIGYLTGTETAAALLGAHSRRHALVAQHETHTSGSAPSTHLRLSPQLGFLRRLALTLGCRQ